MRDAGEDVLRERFFFGVPRYRWLETLGQGSFSVVYLAHDEEMGEPVALKVLDSSLSIDRDEMLLRFKRELSLNRRIKHPNVARLHDIGRSGDLPYLSMEYVPGKTLSQVIAQRGPLPPAVAVPVLRQVALATAAAHGQGVLHRDLKPANILVQESGAVVVVDYGLALPYREPRLTASRLVFGSPHYMSPEQSRGDTLDARSDVYAIGIVSFEALSGALPFTGFNELDVARKQIEEPAPPLLSRSPGAGPVLARIVQRCLEKDPDLRYPSAEALEVDLSAAGAHASAAAAQAGPPLAVIADDDEHLRRLLQGTLERAGFRVEVAADGVEALELLKRRPVRVALLDVWMPRMDGFDVLKTLQLEPIGCPIVLMSASLDRTQIAFATRLGAAHVLQKPLYPHLVVQKLREVLASRGISFPSAPG